jgi:hypothetical protein
VGYWPGKVDTYFDLYAAGVWNIFRAARLLLIALIIKFSDTLGENDTSFGHFHTANHIVEEIVASIPYHLTDNLQAFLSQRSTRTEITDPGKHLGGLLLMHPLYVASEMTFVPRKDARVPAKMPYMDWVEYEVGAGHSVSKCERSGPLIPRTVPSDQ